nr:energy transducer TonB [Terriglobus roseus]
MSAPDHSLTDAAMDAVRHWRDKPYVLAGVPTEVDTTITVNFSFSR